MILKFLLIIVSTNNFKKVLFILRVSGVEFIMELLKILNTHSPTKASQAAQSYTWAITCIAPSKYLPVPEHARILYYSAEVLNFVIKEMS